MNLKTLKTSLFTSFLFLFFIYPIDKLKAQTCRYSSHHQGFVPGEQFLLSNNDFPSYYDQSHCEEFVDQNISQPNEISQPPYNSNRVPGSKVVVTVDLIGV